MIYGPEKYNKNRPNFNQELLKIKGELEPKAAQIALVKFLRANLELTTELICGIRLAPYQSCILRGWFNRNFCLNVLSRGAGKSFMAAIYCILRCIFEPNTKIILSAPTFRGARNIFSEIEKLVNGPQSQLLAQCFCIEPSHKNDLLEWKINGGFIRAIPLNGDKIRGFRANVLIIDEFLLINEDIVKNVLMPFLIAPQNIGERLHIKEMEDDLIQRELMKESERTTFGNTAQMICLSSASFTFENLYRTYKEWISNIYNEEDKAESTYFIAQLGYQALPPEMVEKTIIEEAASGGLENPSFLREYCAQFTDGSSGFFSALKMQACTIPDGEFPHLKLTGDKDKKYIIAIDPNLSNSDTADYFAMAVMELDEKDQSSTLVHNYADAGGDLKDHIAYFIYLYNAFRPEMIITDSADGNFLPSANESEKFVLTKTEIKQIEEWSSDLEGEDYIQMVKKCRQAYNKQGGKIWIKQYFTSDFIRKAHEHLQTCIDYKKVWFGSKIRPFGEIFDRVANSSVPAEILEGRKMGDLIDDQDDLIYSVKKQAALIEVKTTAKGSLTFDLPSHLKRSKSKDRARRDNLTALMLGTWGVKAYFEIMSHDIGSVISTFNPIFIK